MKLLSKKTTPGYPFIPAYALLCAGLLFLCSCTTAREKPLPHKHTEAQPQHLLLTGRFDSHIANQVSFTWPGSQIAFNFIGTGAKLRLSSNNRVRFQVDVDGKQQDLWLEPGTRDYVLAQGLTATQHQLRLTRLTESFNTVTTLIGSPITDGKLLPPPAANPHKLLVIGDSITAGYGNEGDNPNCHYSMETSNQQLSYAALAAKSLNADLHSIAWSGIGAWRTYGETTPINPSILVRYQRTLADDASSQWDSSHYTPDATLINIGTNDYWNGAPGEPYHAAMAQLIAKVQQDYPGKPIYLIVSPMLGGDTRASEKQVLESLAGDQIRVLDLGKIEASEGYGCDYHPNLRTHARLAKQLATALHQDLGW